MRVLASILILVLGAMCVACDGSVRATGRIRDTNKRPLSNANVSLQRSERGAREFTSASDVKGCFSVGGIVAPGRYKYNLYVSLTGYKAFSTEVETLTENNIEIILMPETSEETSRSSPLNTRECDR